MSDLQISHPLTLQCGLTLPNRLVKAAMAEKMAVKSSLPTGKMESSYSKWSDGGWGMIITGNVQIDSKYLGAQGDVALNTSVKDEKRLQIWKDWAQACNRDGTPTIVQINHPGRQSPLGAGDKGLFTKNIAPSAVAMNFGDGFLPRFLSSLIFGTPSEMTTQDIQDVVKGFADTARLSAEAGFAGVQVHAAHGYLLAQFLSEKSNVRQDAYGGSPEARAKIVVEIIEAIHAAVPKEFCVAIKLNSADHQSASALNACVKQLKLITAAGVDFVEVSGGTYENPTMMLGTDSEPAEQPVSSRTVAREAFFLEFAKAIRQDFPEIPLLVTGGFRSRQAMESAVVDGGCDMIGIARPAVLNPSLPKNIIFNTKIQDADAKVHADKIQPSWLIRKIGVKAIGAGTEGDWYSKQIQKMATK